MIKAIIFDLDGTLLNTIEDIHIVLNESLKKFGLSEVSLNQTKRYVGNGAKRLIERAACGAPNEISDKIYEYYVERFSECGDKFTKLFDGEEQFLSALKEADIKLSIVTNKPQRATDNVCRKFLAKFGFYKVLGQTEYYPLKPDPASTLSIIDGLKLKKEECVFIGDGETDVLTAKAAGIKCISVLWGYRTKEQLEAVGADLFAENFNEALNLILFKKFQ